MKKITSAALGLSLTLAVAGLSFAQAPAAAPAQSAAKDSAMSTAAPTAKKHVKKHKKVADVKAAPAASPPPPRLPNKFAAKISGGGRSQERFPPDLFFTAGNPEFQKPFSRKRPRNPSPPASSRFVHPGKPFPAAGPESIKRRPPKGWNDIPPHFPQTPRDSENSSSPSGGTGHKSRRSSAVINTLKRVQFWAMQKFFRGAGK